MRTTFHGKLLLLTILPLAVAQVVTLLAVMRTVENDVDRRARESLHVGQNVVAEYLASRTAQVRTSVSVLAADFGLKEAVATADAATIRSVLANHGQRVGADVALLVGLDGVRVAGTAPLPRTHFERLLAAAGDEDTPLPRHYVESIGSRTYELYAVPLRAPTTIAWIVVGFEAGSALTEQIAVLTGLGAALVNVGTSDVVAASGVPPGSFTDTGPRAPMTDGPGGVYRVGDVASGYLALRTAFVPGESNTRLLLVRSLADAMAPYTQARRWLLLFSCALLGLVAAAAVWISGGIARPVRHLTDAVRDVMSGQYSAAVTVTSDDEIGELAASFNRMRTAIAEREQRIRHQAQHDPLTDLPNRSKIVADVDALIAAQPATTVSVIALRFTRMDSISSTLGQAASDQLITTAARHLKLNQVPGDMLGHVGTNEFVIVLPDQDVADATAHARKLEGWLTTGVALGRVNIGLKTEFGIAGYPDHATSAIDLLRNAAVARTESGLHGETCAVYRAGREKHYEQQLRIVNDLRSAAERDELAVYYQPQIALPSGQVCGVEALVRWQHREYGFLAPDSFVPAAEEAGTITHLTRYVLERAIADCRRWSAAHPNLGVSVNVSARDLQDEYLPYVVLNLLKTHNVEAGRLTLEVTENSVMEKLGQSVLVLECLRDAGVQIAMDDFGTGHSSLAQIRNIPLHELKIDKSFVMTMGSDRHNGAIVRTTLALALELGLKVVAEGVEDEETLRMLSALGCQVAQGYFISKPMTGAALPDWLAAWQSPGYAERRSQDRHFGRTAS